MKTLSSLAPFFRIFAILLAFIATPSSLRAQETHYTYFSLGNNTVGRFDPNIDTDGYAWSPCEAPELDFTLDAFGNRDAYWEYDTHDGAIYDSISDQWFCKGSGANDFSDTVWTPCDDPE